MSAARAGVAVAILLLTAAVFGQVRGHEFVDMDDFVYLVNNPHIEAGLSWQGSIEAFTTPFLAQWTPVSRISLQLHRELGALEPAPVLMVNVTLHALAAVTLFFALAGLTGSTWRSAFVAAVFAVHPLHVESVAWASERKGALSGLFFMLVLLGYARFVARPSGPRYALVTALVQDRSQAIERPGELSGRRRAPSCAPRGRSLPSDWRLTDRQSVGQPQNRVQGVSPGLAKFHAKLTYGHPNLDFGPPFRLTPTNHRFQTTYHGADKRI